MLRLLHGDNIAASRNAFTALKQSADNPIALRGGSFNLTDLMQIFEGGELFATSKNLFLEDLFLKVKKGAELEAYTSYLIKQAVTNTIILWEGKILTKTQLGLLGKVSTELFKLPTQLFSLLDGLKPNNATSLINLAQQIMTDGGDEILFSMLTRQIRILLALRVNSTIEEVNRLAPWQKTKLLQQANFFTTKQLLDLHSLLFDIDRNRKTGANSLSLRASIDFFLLRI